VLSAPPEDPASSHCCLAARIRALCAPHGRIANVIEVIRAGASAAQAKVAIFDFDGTLSVIRSGWVNIMLPMCVEQLVALKSGESEKELTSMVEEFVGRLTGKETIYQMMALSDAIRERGGSPLEPLAYKKIYLERLSVHIKNRLEDLRERRTPSDYYTVPGSRQMLESVQRQGLTLYLASGTDDADVKEEAALLDLAQFFDRKIFGAQDDLASFSKAILVQKILNEASFQPQELVVFGDGYVEIEEVKKAGGIAVGVATAEPECRTIDNWKRQRLIRAGADFIIPNYLDWNEISEVVFSSSEIACETTAYTLT